MKQATISVQDLSGAWAQIGTGQLRGIQPSDVELTSDTWGAKDATFTLTRELFVRGRTFRRSRQSRSPLAASWVAWTHRGRTDELARAPSPSAARASRTTSTTTSTSAYVHTDITQWLGRARLLDADLTLWRAAGLVTSGDGVISLSWPVGTQWDATVSVGVIPRPRPVCGRRGEGGTHVPTPRGQPVDGGAGDALGESVDRLRGTGTFTDGFTPVALNATTTTAQTVEATSPTDRYVCVLLRCDTTYPDAGGRDRHRRDPGVHRHGLRQWRRQRASRRPGREGRAQHRDGPALRRPVADRLPTGSSFYIPEFAPSGPRDPRQAIEGVNVFYDWRTKVDEQDRFGSRTARARPRRWGRRGSSSFEDASLGERRRGSTRPSSPARTRTACPIREVVTSGDLSNVVYEDITGAHLSNPGFESGTSGWAASGSTITQVTTPHTGTYGGRWDNSGASDALEHERLPGDHADRNVPWPGVRYRIYPWIRTNPARPPTCSSRSETSPPAT